MTQSNEKKNMQGLLKLDNPSTPETRIRKLEKQVVYLETYNKELTKLFIEHLKELHGAS